MHEEDVVVNVIVQQAIDGLLNELWGWALDEDLPDDVMERATAKARSAAREAYRLVLLDKQSKPPLNEERVNELLGAINYEIPVDE